MCTVTFIPSGSHCIITSNRDERKGRSPAAVPAPYVFDSGKILFPKDGDAGGSWLAVHENGNAIVLLNGGYVRHVPKPPYRKSRGLILVDMIDSSSPYNSFQAINLNKIEPFTVIILDDQHLFECRWDGKQKHHQFIEKDQPHIWASCTLYNEEVIDKRKVWFNKWLIENPTPTQAQAMHFHQFTGDGDKSNDLLMNREGKVFTVSITSVEINEKKAVMQHLDLIQDISTTSSLPFEKSMAE
ncbi:MAG TPA: NRDE family protein [Flavitalea sp.]|nr:NRDE family protein [Flavitalea sp.]